MTGKKEKHSAEEEIINEISEDEHSAEQPEADNQDKAPKQPNKQDIEALKAENAKLKDAFLRAYAEAENIKKRCQQEIEKNSKFAISSFAKELLSVADNLQRAVSSVDEEHRAEHQALLEGVEMTQKELSHVFEKFGIKKIDCLNKIFDPNFERVVQEIEDPSKPAGTIITELQTGYTLNDRILREAMVIVTKGGK